MKIFSRFYFGVILLIVFSFYLYNVVFAGNISTSALVNTFVRSGQTINATSFATPALGLNLAHGTARTLNAMQITVAGPNGFDPATDLRELAAANDSSGIFVYTDGTGATGDGSFTQGANGDTAQGLSSLPAYSAATRASALTPAQTAMFVVTGTSAITPGGTYATPAVGDIVFYQSTNTAGIWAIVTNATLTSGTFAVNGAALGAGSYSISKIGGGAGNTVAFTTGAAGANAWGSVVGTYSAPALGDIVALQTGTGVPTWGVVTVDTNTNQNTFKINGAVLTADTAYKLTKITSYTPATSAVDGAVAGKLTQGLTFAVGDLVIGTTGAGYVWGVVTTAETVAGAGTISALRINGASATSLFSTATQVSKITASGTGLATVATPTLTAGDVVFANPVLNAAPVAGYNFHAVTTGGAGAAGTALRLDGGTAAPFWPYTTTLTFTTPPAIPADDTTPGNVGSDFYIVVRTGATATNGRQFNVSLRANADLTISDSDAVSLSGLPTNTNTITIDTVVPTVNANMTGPANNSTGVPISAFIHMGFSEQLDQSTINPTNVTFTANSVAVPAGIRPYPDGFDIVVSSPPTFTESSRFAKVASTSTAFYNMMGTNPILPQPPTGYASPTAGDIVITQRETFPPEVGVVTNTTLTSGTFAVNGFPAFGGQQITKFAAPGADHTGGVGAAAKNLTVGDIIVVNTATNPTSVKYDWHMVTGAVSNAAINAGALRLDSLGSAPTFNTHPGGGASSFSAIAPTATETDNGATSGQVLAVTQGDLVFAKLVGGNYGWHLVTTTGNMSSASGEGTAVLDGLTAGTSLVVASSQMSRLSPGAEGAVNASTALSFGDIVLAKTTANASNNGNYAFHMVSGADTVANAGGALRFDNFPGSLTPSTVYVVTATTGVKDAAGNPLAANNTVTFTTGATGGTNTTPPFVQSSQPQPGSQTHPIGAPIRLTFSVDMAISGGGDITSATNIGLFTDNFGAPGTPITTNKAYDSASKTVTLSLPSGTLTASTGYVVKVNTTATSTTSAAFTQPYFLSFRTPSGAADTTAPTVLGVSPANAATGAALGTVATAGFSEDMNPATITASTITLSGGIAGAVTYNPQSRSASFAPSTALTADTSYTFTIISGGSGVKDLSGNALATNFTSTFTTTASADNVKPILTFANADNFSVAVTFSEQMKSGGGPNAADNIANYTLESPVGTTLGLGGKTITYEAGSKTARITGLSLQNGTAETPTTFKITATTNIQDLSGNIMDDTNVPPPRNTQFGTVQNSTTTGGQIGPGGGTIDPSMQGMNPSRVMPMSRGAGATSNYHIEFLAGTSIPSTGQIVLSFPSGFTLTNAAAVTAGTLSFCNADLNGPATDAPTIGSVVANNDAGTVTITTATADTGANAFLCMDLSDIVNSTVPSSTGYTVTIQTKNTAAANRATLQNITTAPFFLGTAGSNILTVHVFKDANSDNVKDSNEGVPSAAVFLFSPATGGQEATTTTGASGGVATFSNLANGDYMVGIKPTAAIDVAFNSAPQPIAISGNTTKKFALSSAAAITIAGNIDGSGVANGTKVDVFASSPNGFAKTTITLNGTNTNAYSLPVSPNNNYNVGVGPAMPESSFTPGSPPPPPPDFTFMPPPNLQVAVASISVTGKNFTLSAAGKTITGTVVDSSATGVSGAGVFCRPVAASTTSGASGFGTGAQTNTSGAFTVKVTEGVYLCGVFKPGMPPVSEKQITVGASSNTPADFTGTRAFVLDAATTLTITGTIKDDSGNAIPYAGVSGRKVVSSSVTTSIGGDSGNFVGGPTDANGAYTLYVSAGTWVVEAFAPGFGRLGTKTITITASSSSGQDFSAQNTTFRTITGTATSGGSNTPTQGVMIRADTASGSNGNMSISAADGTYTIKVPDGTYNVSCFFPGVGDSAAVGGSVTLSSGTTTAVRNCTAGTLVAVTIRITDGTNGITGAGVDVRDSSGRGNFTNTSTSLTVSSVTYAVYTINVPPGTYTVRAGHPAYGSLGTTTAVSATGTITYNVGSAKQLYAVTGTVNGNGSPLSGAWVSLNGTPTGATNTVFLGAQTVSNGTFSISVPPGVYKVRADKPGYKTPAETTVTVTTATIPAGVIALTTTTRTITGTISITDIGAVSNAFVDATDGNGGYAVAQTNASGVYTLNVDNGTWTIRAHSMGYEGGPLPVTVSGSDVSSQNITLTAISGFTIKAERPETVTPTSGGFLTNTDIGDAFKLNIPANALGTGSNAATVTTKINTAMPNPPSGAIMSKNAVSIDAVGSDGSPISSLNDAITITIPYTEADIPAGTSESSLVIGVWNDATSTYDTLATTVDTTLNTLTATVSHLSDFAPLVASGGSAPETPTGLTLSVQPNSGTIVNVSWNAVSGAASYNIYKSTDNSTFPLNGSSDTTGYNATGLTAGTLYYFKVSAVNSTGDESAATSASSVTPTLIFAAIGSVGDTTPASNSPGPNSPSSSSSSSSSSASVLSPITTAIDPGCGIGNKFSATTGKICAVNSATPAVPGVSSVVPATPATPAKVYNLGVTTLKNGSRGEAVKELQRLLNAKLNLGLTIDGSLGPKTITVIKQWQKDNGLVADGLIGAKTKAMMNAQVAGTATTSGVTATMTKTSYNLGASTLKNGSRGEAVKELQRLLNAKLNLGLTIDGSLGPKTITVIKQWQKDNGLVADGLIGAKTKAIMNASVQ